MPELKDKLRFNHNVKSTTHDVKSSVLKAEGFTEIVDVMMESSDTEIYGVKAISEGEVYTEATNGEMGTNGNTNLGVKTLSKGEDYMHCANGETIPCETTTHDAKSTLSQKNSNQISKVRKSTVGENLNFQSMIVDMGIASDVMHSGADANGDSSKKRKRRVPEDKKLAVGVILNTEIANSGMQDTLSTEGLSMKSYVYGGQQTDANIASSLSEKLTIGNDKILNDENLDASSLENFKYHHEVQPMRIFIAKSRKKLLILDVNGLLADVINPPPKDQRSDKNILRRAIFKRPFLDDFLGFCFNQFDVAIWSSRTRKILDPVVDYLLGNFKKKLLFLWDSSYCTNSSVRCLENKHKSMVFKELRKIWEENGFNLYYDESNTLLLDDSPYKALLNPKHTGIFPLSYSYKHTNDNSLGPDGDIRVYLEGVATTENVKKYVEQHPFGQHAIDETNPHWTFYSDVLKNVSQVSQCTIQNLKD